MKHTLQTKLAGVVTAAIVSVGMPQVAAGSAMLGPPEATAPVEGPESPVTPEPESEPESLPDIEPAGPLDELPPPPTEGEADATPTEDAPPTSEAAKPAIEPPPPTMQEPTTIRVAVGLSTELDGSAAEKELLDALEAAVQASPDPRSDVRRLRVGSAEPRQLCREGRDDLVINVGYMPDRDEPVLLTYDCRIDEALGIRAREAADDPGLLGVLWTEHNQRIAEGAKERRRARVSPKVRTGLIAGAAVAVIGAAISLLIVGAVQRDTVVLVVSPSP